MSVEIRKALASDIDDLAAIEAAVFPGDRISRRSFRALIERETAEALVAISGDRLAGYAIVLFRKGSGVARLYSIATGPDFGGQGVGRLLLDAAETAAFDHDRLLLRLEVREDNARAIRIYEKAGYRRIGREPDYYEDGATALRYEKTLRGGVPVATAVPFYEQTCDFTCGPCCLMMAMAHFDPSFVPDPVMEIRLWREATTVFMMSGPGGCEPFGLAVSAHEGGLSAEIYVSFYGALFLQSVRSAEKRRVMELAQVDFRRRAEAYAGEEGLWPLHARVAGLLARLGEQALPLAGRALDVLTPAEQRVARLAARELTNRQVAAELEVSVKGVEWHLSRIYRKLGITSRAALATLLADEGRSLD